MRGGGLRGQSTLLAPCAALTSVDRIVLGWSIQRGRIHEEGEACTAPSWFEPFAHRNGTKFDHLGSMKALFTIAGGYVIKKVNGQRVIKQFGSSEKRKRFNAEDRAFIAAIRDPKASTIRADGQPGGEDRAAPSPGAPAPGDLL